MFALRCLVDELGQLRSDPSRQRSGDDGALHGKLIGSISDGSLFLTLPTRVLTGQQIISSEGYGASTAFKSRTVAGCSPSHAGHTSGFSTTGIRLWSSAHNSFGVVVMIANEQTHSPAGECQFSHKPASAMMQRDRRARLHEAVCLRPSSSIRRSCRPARGSAGVPKAFPKAGLLSIPSALALMLAKPTSMSLAQYRDQAPTQHIETALPVLGVVADDGQGVGRGDVPAWWEIRCRPLGRDREGEPDLADVARETNAATHDANISALWR